MKDKRISHRICPDCGAPLTTGFRFCGQCGASIEPDTVMQSLDSRHLERSPHMQSAKEITWEQDMPLLNNRFFLWDSLRVMVITLVVMQLLLLVMSIIIGGDIFFMPPEMILILVGILSGLFLIAILLVLQNRFNLRFTVDANGFSYDSGSREKKINRIVFWLSLLSGKPGPIGSSLLSLSQEDKTFNWRDIYKVTVHPGPRVITLDNSWRMVFRLYCNPENFEKVAEQVQAYAAEGEAWRKSHGIHPPRYGFYVKWAGMTAIAFIASLTWLSGYDVMRMHFWQFYWKADDIAPLALIVSFVVLLAGMFEGKKGRAVALFATMESLLFLYRLYTLVLGQYTDIEKTYSFYGYEVDPALFAISFIGGLALAAMSLVRLLGKVGAENARNQESHDDT
ncbi:MAG: zinc ribbon domain-containing protein [Candidatus Methanoperedens sp.]|nr:zinc ribbon domain-containing protein [Candidatus Methanoperedens sp.]